MRAKNAGQRRIEFELDALARLLELRKCLLKRLLQPSQLAFNIVLADRFGRAAAFEHVADHPGLPHAQARRDAASDESHFRSVAANGRLN